MTEEEKKAIETVKEIGINTYAEGKAKVIFTVLKLIEKQQNAIKYQKQRIHDLEEQVAMFIPRRRVNRVYKMLGKILNKTDYGINEEE